jgi:hypothetical protein
LLSAETRLKFLFEQKAAGAMAVQQEKILPLPLSNRF